MIGVRLSRREAESVQETDTRWDERMECGELCNIKTSLEDTIFFLVWRRVGFGCMKMSVLARNGLRLILFAMADKDLGI